MLRWVYSRELASLSQPLLCPFYAYTQVHLRVFPDIPVCVKGNETRMGKGKGSFEYWACRVPAGRVVMEVAGGGIREEIARQALKLAQVKFAVGTEFVNKATPPRLGNIVSPELTKPPEAQSSVDAIPTMNPVEQSVVGKHVVATLAPAAEGKAEARV